jgi:hypothetical protein
VLSQASAYLAETGLSEARYLELLQERASEVLVRGRPSTYPMSLAVSWGLALDQLSADHPAARELLGLGQHAGDPCDLAEPDEVAAGLHEEQCASGLGECVLVIVVAVGTRVQTVAAEGAQVRLVSLQLQYNGANAATMADQVIGRKPGRPSRLTPPRVRR